MTPIFSHPALRVVSIVAALDEEEGIDPNDIHCLTLLFSNLAEISTSIQRVDITMHDQLVEPRLVPTYIAWLEILVGPLARLAQACGGRIEANFDFESFYGVQSRSEAIAVSIERHRERIMEVFSSANVALNFTVSEF